MEEGKRAWTNRTRLLFGKKLGEKTGSKFAGGSEIWEQHVKSRHNTCVSLSSALSSTTSSLFLRPGHLAGRVWSIDKVVVRLDLENHRNVTNVAFISEGSVFGGHPPLTHILFSTICHPSLADFCPFVTVFLLDALSKSILEQGRVNNSTHFAL